MAQREWLMLDSGAGEHAFNMALDEALLEAMPRLGRPVLRFYGWVEPAASFGYFQKYSDVERFTGLRPLVRRPTGGGVVPHDRDWTYSAIFPASYPWYGLAAVESYARIHRTLQSAFARLNIGTELAPEARHCAPGQCFEGHEKNDLLWHGRKIAGAAQRRRREGLLIQGSVQGAGLKIARNEWQRAVCAELEESETASWKVLELDAELRERAAELVQKKYAQPAYNRNRGHVFDRE